MVPARVRTICVDINPAVGTDFDLFLKSLEERLSKR